MQGFIDANIDPCCELQAEKDHRVLFVRARPCFSAKLYISLEICSFVADY